MEIYDLNFCNKDISCTAKELTCKPLLIAKNVDNLNKKDIQMLITSNIFLRDRIIQDVITGMKRGEIRRSDLDNLQNTHLKKKIKINYVRQEIGHLKLVIKLKELIAKQDLDSLRHANVLLLAEMMKIKDDSYNKIHKEYTKLYRKISKMLSQYDYVLTNEECQKVKWLNKSENFKDISGSQTALRNNIIKNDKVDISRIHKRILECSQDATTVPSCIEEYLYNIENTQERLEIEEQLLKYNEKQMKYIIELKNSLMNENLTKTELKSIMKNCKHEMEKFHYKQIQPEWQERYKDVFEECYIKLKMLFECEPSVSPTKKNFGYKMSRWGYVNPNITSGINKRYENGRTIFHNEAINNTDKDYVQYMVYLIKIGANITLRDDKGCTPMDYINEETVRKIHKNLDATLKNWDKESTVGLRLYRAKLEIERDLNDNQENIQDYFRALKKFVKRQSSLKSKGDLEDLLSLHVYHDENKFLREQREQYFKNQIQENNQNIEKLSYKLKGFAVSSKKSHKYIKYQNQQQEYIKENKLIKEYLLEDSNEKFNSLKDEIKTSIRLLRNNNYGDKINRILVNDIKNFFREYPTQVDITIDDKDILREFIKQKNIPLIKVLVKNGRNLNYYSANGKLPIEYALETNDTQFIEKMIELGVNLDSVTKDGKKVSRLILDTNNKDLIEYTMKDLDNAHNIYQGEDVSKIVEIKDENMLKRLVGHGFDIDCEDEQGFNLLEKAIIKKDLAEINKLIKIGADSKKADAVVRALLKQELEAKRTNYPMKKFIRELKEETPKLNDIEVRNYMSIASEYILDGKLNELEKVICECSEVLKRQNEGGLNLLSQMILSVETENKLAKVVNIIKNHPYTINEPDIAVNKLNNNTPIHYIIEKISQSKDAILILEKILPYVTNVGVLDERNINGMTALDCAIAINNMDAVKMLYRKNMELKKEHIERKDNIIHMQYAMLNNELLATELREMILEVVKLRSENEKDVTFRDILNDNGIQNRQSMLHIAAYLKRDDIAKYLIEQDINLNVKDVGGRTPIYYAVVAQNLNQVTDLIVKDERILQVVDIKNATPLHYAVITQNEDIVSLILSKSNKSLGVQDIEGRTALHYAVLSQNVNIVKAILSRITKKDILNMQDVAGRTALHYAALGGNVDILNCFVRNRNVVFNIEDSLGQKAVDYLLQSELKVHEVLNKFEDNIPSVIRKILARKEKRQLRYSKTALHSACQNRITPKEAISIVLEEKEDEIPSLINSPLYQRTGKTALQMAIENNVPQDSLVEMIKKGKLLDSKLKKDKLLDKLLEYNLEEVARRLGLKKEYHNKSLKLAPSKLYNLIKYQNTSQSIKCILGIPQSVDCRGFELYDYAIVKDRYDWYCEFCKGSKNLDMDKVKEKVIDNNAINILNELLKDGEDFNNKTLWKKASSESREAIIKHYMANKTIEKEVKKAANQLNINMVNKILERQNIPIDGLMHIAVKKNSVNLARVIIEYYGKGIFYEKDRNGKTPCDLAKDIKNKDILTYLIMNGAKIDGIKRENLTLGEVLINLQIKVARDNATILSYANNTFDEKISKMSKNEINKRDSLGNTLLFYAIKKNDRSKVLGLLNRGALVNLTNKYGQTPLYMAVKYASKEIVKDLISKGANPKQKIRGKSMLHYAMKRKIDDKERERDTKNSIALTLMQKGVIDLTPSTMNEKIRYDKIFGNDNVTQLMYHIMVGNKDIARQLIQSDCIDLSKVDNRGFTAYGYAKNKKFQDLMELMKAKDVNITDKQNHEENTAIYKILGAGMTILGITARRTRVGGVTYDLFENVLLDKGKNLLGESTREIIEKIQDSKRKTEEKLRNIYKIKGVAEGIELIKDEFYEDV